MEDAHAAILDLQPEDSTSATVSKDKRISFFGVYDGHGGDRVALFAGENVHKIIAKQEMYSKGDYEQALKDGFLATDRAILNGTQVIGSGTLLLVISNGAADPKYENEVSGCTASVALLSESKIYVVSDSLTRRITAQANYFCNAHRPMLGTLEVFWGSKGEQSLCHLTTSHRTKVSLCGLPTHFTDV